MTKKTLKKIAELSYNKDLLDEQTVAEVAEKLSRKDLKRYIKELHNQEKIREVYVTSATQLTTADKSTLEKIYTDKKIVYKVDTTMIAGIKVIENDQEYEINLNRIFTDIIQFVSTK